MRKAEYLWKKLVEELNKLPDETTKADLYNFLRKWIIDNQIEMGEKAIENRGLIEMAELKPTDYALEYTEETVTSIIAWINRTVPPNSNDSLAMRLNDYLEDLIVFNIEQDCANNCSSGELGVWKNSKSTNIQFVYVCPLCNFIQYPNGKPYNQEKIGIAKKAELEEEKLLPSSNLISSLYNAIVSSVKHNK